MSGRLILAPANSSFNIGQDLRSLQLVASDGTVTLIEQLGIFKSLELSQKVTPIQTRPMTMGGATLNTNIPSGWSGRLVFARLHGGLATMFAGLESSFITSGARSNFSICGSVFAPETGAVDQFMVASCALVLDGAGRFVSTGEVEESVSFEGGSFTTTGGSA